MTEFNAPKSSNTKRFARIALLAALLGGVGIFANAKLFGGECCSQGSACCKPGAACCSGGSGAHASL